ncbi:MAG: hypothetical protein ACREEV_01270, partial [Dongiaceae bacterium]
SDVEASVSGLFVTRRRYVFVTAVAYPAYGAHEGTAQQITLAANGTAVATYEIAERAEITAIVPADLIGADRLLTLEFRVANLVRPADLGAPDEARAVGVGLAMLKVE